MTPPLLGAWHWWEAGLSNAVVQHSSVSNSDAAPEILTRNKNSIPPRPDIGGGIATVDFLSPGRSAT